jgi:sulfur-oxidizing protein SoxY
MNRQMPNRRQMLARSATVASLLAGVGLWPVGARAAWPQAAFGVRGSAAALKALGVGAPVESSEVTIVGPDIAEEGSQVPVTLATTLPGARRLVLLVEKNPNALAAVFDLTPAIEARFNTHVKMAESSAVMVVALTADGRVLFAQRDIKVTLGGCG